MSEMNWTEIMNHEMFDLCADLKRRDVSDILGGHFECDDFFDELDELQMRKWAFLETLEEKSNTILGYVLLELSEMYDRRTGRLVALEEEQELCEANSTSEKAEEPKKKIIITPENIYDYFVVEEFDDGIDGFSYVQNYDIIGGNDEDEGFDELHEKMFNEIRLGYEDFHANRSCMWVEEVKRRAKWVRGETLYGYSREKNYRYPIWWSKDREKIGHSTWILEADGYVSFSFANGYTRAETANTKCGNYYRPACLYNDINCDELAALKKN